MPQESKFKYGDRVEVVNYGSLLWRFNKDGSGEVLDIAPYRIGKIGVIRDVSLCQGKYSYGLLEDSGNESAWYDDEQLQLIT